MKVREVCLFSYSTLPTCKSQRGKTLTISKFTDDHAAVSCLGHNIEPLKNRAMIKAFFNIISLVFDLMMSLQSAARFT